MIESEDLTFVRWGVDVASLGIVLVSSVVGAQQARARLVVVGQERGCSLTADYLSHLSFVSWWVIHSYEQRLRYYEMV